MFQFNLTLVPSNSVLLSGSRWFPPLPAMICSPVPHWLRHPPPPSTDPLTCSSPAEVGKYLPSYLRFRSSISTQ